MPEGLKTSGETADADRLLALAAAMDAVDHGYSIKLTSLTEAGSTYTLDLCDGTPLLTFSDSEDAREHANKHRSLAKAQAAIDFLAAPSPPTAPALASDGRVGDESALQDDLRQLLTLLGLGDHARPQSPHEVFQHALDYLKGRLKLSDEAFATLRDLYDAASEGAFVPEEPMDRADRLFSWEKSFREDWAAEDEQ